MKQRLLLLFYIACYAMLSGVATAAINSGGIVNAASYRRVGLPNSGIAQGSIFLVFGSNLGPAQLTTDPDFPLGTSLAGTSIKVTVNAVTVDIQRLTKPDTTAADGFYWNGSTWTASLT